MTFKLNIHKLLISFLLYSFVFTLTASAQNIKPILYYTVSMPQPSSQYFHVELTSSGWHLDNIDFKMPKWMPGYYQLMNYAKEVENFLVKDKNGNIIPVKKLNENTWRVPSSNTNSLHLSYNVKATRAFVATNFLDSTHAYLLPAGLFLYVDGYIKNPVTVKINMPRHWNNIATGLTKVAGKTNEFTAPDFDILYDCPLLIGNLEELPSFKVKGVTHRFIGYKMSQFNKELFTSWIWINF